MKVFELLPARPLTATWLQQLLEPAYEAARIRSPRGIELRPLPRSWAGFSPGRDSPHGRISLSSRARWWSSSQLVYVAIHEQGHALLEEAAPDTDHAHDAAFFALTLALLLRLDEGFLQEDRISAWCTGMSLYDIQDAPPCWADAAPQVWIPRALAWAMEVADQLASSDKDALELASEIDQAYSRQVRIWEAEPARLAQRQRKADQLQADLAKARDDATVRGWLALTGFAGLLSCVFLALLR